MRASSPVGHVGNLSASAEPVSHGRPQSAAGIIDESYAAAVKAGASV